MCRFRYYNPRASWVLKPFFPVSSQPENLLQPTCIVGTKTVYNYHMCILQPTCIVGTKTPRITDRSADFHYNPRVSWMFRIKIAIKKCHFISDAFFKMTHKKNLLANLSNYHIPFSEIKKPPLPAMRSGKGGFLSIYKKRSRFLR